MGKEGRFGDGILGENGKRGSLGKEEGVWVRIEKVRRLPLNEFYDERSVGYDRNACARI
jgi:hypothetical protein